MHFVSVRSIRMVKYEAIASLFGTLLGLISIALGHKTPFPVKLKPSFLVSLNFVLSEELFWFSIVMAT